MSGTHRTGARALAVVMTLLIAAGTALPALAMQANGNSYVSRTTGQTVAWNAPWSYDTQDSTTEAGSEVVFLTSDIAITMIAFLPTGIDMNQSRDQVLATFQKDASSFKTLDRGSYANVSYSLDLAEIKSSSTNQNVPFGVFTLFLGNRGNGATEVYIFMAPVVAFTQGMNSAKQTITVGGAAVFDGVTPDGLQSLLDKNAPSGGQATSNQPANQTASKPTTTPTKTTPEPTQATTKEATGGLDAGSLNLGGGNETTNTPTRAAATKSPSKTTTGDQGSVDPAMKALGVTAPGKYTSPQFGVNVAWSTKLWKIDQNKQGTATLQSDTANGYDLIMLDTGAGDSGFVIFTITDVKASPDQVVSAYSSDAFFQKMGFVNARVVKSGSSDTGAMVLIRHDLSATDSTPILELYQASYPAGSDGQAYQVLTRAVTPFGQGMTGFFGAMMGLNINDQPLLDSPTYASIIAAAATQ